MRVRGAALWPGLLLAGFLALLAFVLSFDALRMVALASGVNVGLAWMFPLIVDGSTLMFTWAAWAFRTRGLPTLYPWLMLVVFSLVSLAGNALHARPVALYGMRLASWIPPLILTMPPIALLAATHMIVLAAGRSYDQQTVDDHGMVLADGEPVERGGLPNVPTGGLDDGVSEPPRVASDSETTGMVEPEPEPESEPAPTEPVSNPVPTDDTSSVVDDGSLLDAMFKGVTEPPAGASSRLRDSWRRSMNDDT